jgi:hypothetical protein
MKVKRCFGTSGQKDCLMALCEDSSKCYECYLKYFIENKKGFNSRLREVIETYMKDNKLRYKNE